MSNAVKNVNVKSLFNLRELFKKFLEIEPIEMSQSDEILLSYEIDDKRKKTLGKSLEKNEEFAKQLFETKEKKSKKGKLSVQNVEIEEVSKNEQVKEKSKNSDAQKEL